MKHQRIILVIVGLFVTITSAYSIFVGKPEIGSGSTKPPCSNVATGRTSLQFTSIDLRYDLTDQANHQMEKPCVRNPRSPSAVDPRKQV